MRMKSVKIEHFGSIKSQALDELGSYTVLVGRNGSGKTLLLEALTYFFGEFAVTGGSTQLSSSLLWFSGDTTQPITISVTVDFSKDEITDLFAPAVIASIPPPSKSTGYSLYIQRSLQYGGSWRTDFIKLDSISLVENDEVVDKDESEQTPSPLLLEHYTLYLFEHGWDQSNIGGTRLLVNELNKVAFHSNPRIDQLVATGVLHVSTEFAGQDYKDWANSRGLVLHERAPDLEEAPELFDAINPKLSRASSAKIQLPALEQKLRTSFRYIRSVRATLQAGPRQPSLPPDILHQIHRVSQSDQPSEQRIWRRYKDDTRQFIGKDAEPHPSGPQFWADGLELKLPPGHLGGGEQSFLHLRALFLDAHAIYLIDEPELHFHPSLCREVYRWLKRQSNKSQVFLATHSPIFVDKAQIINNWLVELQDGETSFQCVENREELRNVLAGLGVLPSDIFLNDVSLFVEGPSDVTFLEHALPKAGLDLKANSIGIVSLGGDNTRVKDALSLWVGLMGESRGKYMVVLDGNRAQAIQDLVREKKWNLELFQTWKAGSLEDLYPPELVSEVMKQLTDKDIPVDKLKKGQISRVLESELGKNELNRRKRSLALLVGERLEEKDVHREINDLAKALQKMLA